LETGLPNLWYLIVRSEDVADRPVALKRLDRNIVPGAARMASSTWSRLLPASGAPLSMGEIVNAT